MAETPPNSKRAQVFAILSGGFTAMVVVKIFEKTLTPSVGEWGAFGIGIAVGCFAAGIVGAIVFRLAGGQNK